MFERRLRRFGSLVLRLSAYGVSVVVCGAAILGLALLIFGAEAFRSTAPSVGLLVVSLAAGFVIAIPVWRALLSGHRFHCFFCEGETARVRRHDLRIEDDWWRSVRYTFECERCGRIDSQF